MRMNNIIDEFNTISITRTKYNELIKAEDKYNNLINCLNNVYKSGEGLNNKEIAIIIATLHAPEIIKTCMHKAEEDSEQQALLDGVELGRDYNLNVAPEDMEKYLEITAGADKPKECI